LYSLSQGKEIPAQIPVADAMNLIVKENSSAIQSVMQKLEQLNTSTGEGAKVFDNVASNKVRAITALSFDQSWKENSEKFKRSIIYNVNVNGFNNNVLKLSSTDWNELHSYLSGVF
jgi:hypothetical protein